MMELLIRLSGSETDLCLCCVFFAYANSRFSGDAACIETRVFQCYAALCP